MHNYYTCMHHQSIVQFTTAFQALVFQMYFAGCAGTSWVPRFWLQFLIIAHHAAKSYMIVIITTPVTFGNDFAANNIEKLISEV